MIYLIDIFQSPMTKPTSQDNHVGKEALPTSIMFEANLGKCLGSLGKFPWNLGKCSDFIPPQLGVLEYTCVSHTVETLPQDIPTRYPDPRISIKKLKTNPCQIHVIYPGYPGIMIFWNMKYW